ncbi:MAG: coenzyme F420-0:L-glutamate ligase [Halobacteria archaeon]|nr:coenzyme F420-0:L-glutamate ligase [Halobacteria archaeon]
MEFESLELPEIGEEDSVGGLIRERFEEFDDDPEVVCVASTVVSKSEGRTRSLGEFEPSERAVRVSERIASSTDSDEVDPRFVEAVLGETVELLIEEPFLLSVTDFGHVAPNAGVDRSNVEGEEKVLLLPKEPRESARRIRQEVGVPVIVTDTCGRPFRRGQTGVAVGWSGVEAVLDSRGEKDLHGRELEATEEAVVDEIAGGANLVMGEGGRGTPVVGVSGVEDLLPDGDGDGGNPESLYRSKEDDIVRQALLERKEKGQEQG